MEQLTYRVRLADLDSDPKFAGSIQSEDVRRARRRICLVCESCLAEEGKNMCLECSKWGVWDYAFSVVGSALMIAAFYALYVIVRFM